MERTAKLSPNTEHQLPTNAPAQAEDLVNKALPGSGTQHGRSLLDMVRGRGMAFVGLSGVGIACGLKQRTSRHHERGQCDDGDGKASLLPAQTSTKEYHRRSSALRLRCLRQLFLAHRSGSSVV